MAGQKPTQAERPILEELRLRNARSSLLRILGAKQRHLESLALAREMALPSCSLIVMSYDSGKPKFLLLYKKHGGRALGPSGSVEDGENPLESLRRISSSQLGLGGNGLKAVSECYVPASGNGRECHTFVLHVTLQKLRDIAGEVNSGRHPDFVLGCVACAGELAKDASLDATHSMLAKGIAEAEKLSA